MGADLFFGGWLRWGLFFIQKNLDIVGVLNFSAVLLFRASFGAPQALRPFGARMRTVKRDFANAVPKNRKRGIKPAFSHQ